MIGGADENDAEDVRPSTRTTTPPPPSSPPIAPPSSPAKPTSLGRRLLGSIRALASHPAPPLAAAAVPKVGLGLLLHLRPEPDHPRLHPTPSASASTSEEDEDAAARPHVPAAAGPHSPGRLGDAAATSAPANTMFRQCATKRAPHLLQHLRPAAGVAVGEDQVAGHGQDEQFCASDKSGASEEENLLGDKEKVAEQQGAVHRKGAALVKDVDVAGGDQEEKVCTGDQLRPANQERDGTTCCGIAAQGDQEKAVQHYDIPELGTTENDGEVAEDNDQEAVEQGVIDTAMDDDNAVKDHEVVGESVITGIEMHATVGIQDQHKGVDAMVNGSDRGIGKKEKVKLPYPQRPGKLNCPSYMSKGSCSYGFSCHYHHPPLKANPDVSWCPSEQGNHDVADILELNHIGLPIREGARNCTYYMRNGACRYGKHCHFNHPEHDIDAQFYAPTGWEDSTFELEKSSDHHTTLDDTSHLKKSSEDATLDDTSYSKKSSDHATLDDTSHSKKSSHHATIDDTSFSSEVLPPNILRMLLPPQKVLPGTELKVVQVKKDSNWSSTPYDSDGCCSADSSDGPSCKQEHVDSSDGPLCKQEHVDYPERPGRSECPFYKRFGDCKFASACNYHHPKEKYPTRYRPEIPSLGGEQTEYPERPGEPECPFYMKYRFCRFMAKCRFNHPKDPNHTAQSPTNTKKSVATDEHYQSTRTTLEDHMPQQQQYPERPGQPDCRYYLQFRKCKFLSACIFNHPRDGLPVGWNPSDPAHSDQIGPEIHGMPECPFYIKSRKCKFGSACEFRHPRDICSTTEEAFGHRTDLANDNFTRPENVVQKQEQTMYPERPGEPPCLYYMRHGSCRFQMNCKYHHPADRLSRKQYDST